ncbi:hypothetical protein MED121_09433 [Marinomonas sp. MED121]|nr:hypothetical protein MED121_09433 [Marinomonas sp. MED121]
MASLYFAPDVRLWGNSMGVAVIVGTALILATGPLNLTRIRTQFFQVMRLVLCPFFVSSFSALTKGKGFFLVFSPVMLENLTAVIACLIFVIVAKLAKKYA